MAKRRNKAAAGRVPAVAQAVTFKPATPADLKRLGPKMFGLGWQTRMAEALGVDASSVRRWISGAVPIPGPVSTALWCWARCNELGASRLRRN